jgi:hypothetical protein
MVTSCFFCQNLLSDFVERLLPASRHEELERHLEGCRDCTLVLRDLKSTLEILGALAPRPLSADMALQITEASLSGRAGFFSRTSVSQLVLFLIGPCLLFATAVVSFPHLFPWFSQLRAEPDESHFARYFPLLQGGNEIVDEQANWLQVREPFMRSVWEEGGLSPEEFEKSFQGLGQGKGAKGEDK